MGYTRITPDKLTEQLNTIRQVVEKNPALNSKRFTRTELLELLGKNGLNVNPVLWSCLKEVFHCEKINGVNTWTFQRNDRGTLPIYKGVIESVVMNYRKKMNDKKSQSLSVDSAIKLLKSKGYKIQKPVISYKEIQLCNLVKI